MGQKEWYEASRRDPGAGTEQLQSRDGDQIVAWHP
jgi:hypothetical protein